jgi:AraC-like DNA-binding protein
MVHQFTGCSFVNVQIVFQPTAIFRLSGIPAYELTDQHIDAIHIFPKNIQFTLEQLQCAKSYDEMLTIIESFSLKLIKHSKRDKHALDHVTRKLLLTGGNISLDSQSDEACLCTKQFTRKFYERVGVNPKTYARIIRFNRAYNIKNAYPENDWLDIAVECGYYDHQHLIKDYKQFTGKTPDKFHRMESEAPERVLGLTEHLYQQRVNRLK